MIWRNEKRMYTCKTVKRKVKKTRLDVEDKPESRMSRAITSRDHVSAHASLCMIYFRFRPERSKKICITNPLKRKLQDKLKYYPAVLDVTAALYLKAVIRPGLIIELQNMNVLVLASENNKQVASSSGLILMASDFRENKQTNKLG